MKDGDVIWSGCSEMR